MKRTAKEITHILVTRLWEKYLERVWYAKYYNDLVAKNNGEVVFDHIAFRTFNTHTGEQPEGIRAFRHILKCLGFRIAEKYTFQKKRLSAVHFEHDDEFLPKIFVSQLEVNQLPDWAQTIINNTVRDTIYILSDHSIELLNILNSKKELPLEAADFLVKDLENYFERPWNVPNKIDVLKLNDISQYGAWVLLHGNSVNHFAVLMNHQKEKGRSDFDTTIKTLSASGIPMKDKVEGSNGSLLRQCSTLAVKEEIDVITDLGTEKINWTYAYFELTERGKININGENKLFNGFLTNQSNNLFGMTRTRDN